MIYKWDDDKDGIVIAVRLGTYLGIIFRINKEVHIHTESSGMLSWEFLSITGNIIINKKLWVMHTTMAQFFVVCWWHFALKEKCLPHAPHLSGVGLCSVPFWSTNRKISLKTGPQFLQGLEFREDTGAIIFFDGNILRAMFCSMDASMSSAPQQKSEQKNP